MERQEEMISEEENFQNEDHQGHQAHQRHRSWPYSRCERVSTPVALWRGKVF